LAGFWPEKKDGRREGRASLSKEKSRERMK